MLIIHYLESLSVGGAQALMYELYDAIRRGYPQHEQMICLRRGAPVNKPFNKFWKAPYTHINPAEIVKKFGRREDVVVLFNKLKQTDMSATKIFHKYMPVIIVNHTLISAKTCKGKHDAIVSVSKHMHRLEKIWNPDSYNVLIRNAVGYKNYELIEARKTNYKGCLVTGRINRVVGIKYSDSWLKWCATVKLPKKLVHEFMGVGEDYKRAVNLCRILKQKYRDAKGNIVRMIGSFDGFEQKIRILKSWDIFLYEVNHNEGTSMSVLESLACSVPVICSNHYGNKELIEDGINGYVYKKREDLKNILTDICQKGKIEKLKQTTKTHFKKNLDARFMADKYIVLCDKLLQKRL